MKNCQNQQDRKRAGLFRPASCGKPSLPQAHASVLQKRERCPSAALQPLLGAAAESNHATAAPWELSAGASQAPFTRSSACVGPQPLTPMLTPAAARQSAASAMRLPATAATPRGSSLPAQSPQGPPHWSWGLPPAGLPPRRAPARHPNRPRWLALLCAAERPASSAPSQSQKRHVGAYMPTSPFARNAKTHCVAPVMRASEEGQCTDPHLGAL